MHIRGLNPLCPCYSLCVGPKAPHRFSAGASLEVACCAIGQGRMATARVVQFSLERNFISCSMQLYA